jgi:hypothetical protein
MAAVRTRGCGWGCTGRAVLADGRRMRGADTRTGSGALGVVGACAAARHGVARVRWLRLARGLCEIGVVWVEVCGLVGAAAVVGREWRRRERAGRRPLGRRAAVGSAAVWGFGCVWLVGGVVRVLAAGRGLGSATWRAMRARPRAAAVGSWLVMCAASTRPSSDFLFCWAISWGRACLLRGRGDARRDAPWLLLRTRGCGWGCAGRAVMADGRRMRGADTRTGSGALGVVGACAAARHGVARVRGLRLARGLCEPGVGWVEACGFVGMADEVGRRWRRRERAGQRPLGRRAAVGSAAVWGLGVCGWLVVWCVCLRRDGGFESATWRAMRARPCAAAVGSWLVMCAASTRPSSDFLFCWAISRGLGLSVEGGVARVRGLRLARGLCEPGVGWVEACGFVGMADVVGRRWRRRERAGRRPLWAERCGWIGCELGFGFVWLVGGVVRVLVAGRGVVGDLACDAGAPACGGRWIVAGGVCS